MTKDELAAFIKSDTGVYNGHTLLEWAQIGSFPDMVTSLRNLIVSAPAENISAADAKAALVSSPGWLQVPASVVESIKWMIYVNPIPIGNAGFSAAIEEALSAYPAQVSAWVSLKVRQVSFYELHNLDDYTISAAMGAAVAV